MSDPPEYERTFEIDISDLTNHIDRQLSEIHQTIRDFHYDLRQLRKEVRSLYLRSGE